MRSIRWTVAAAGCVALAACSPGQAVVTAEIEVPDPETGGTTTRQLSDLEIQLLPYDRDQVFDSLEAAFPDPEPEIPDSLLAAREEVAQAQREWRQLESRWNTLRDTLQSISDEMSQYNRGESRYVTLFREFQELEGELNSVEEQVDDAFQRFDSLQQGIIQQSEALGAEREEWANRAFADAFDVIQRKIDEAGREPQVDTTGADGTVTFSAPPGEWWVHARYELSYSELYWNEPVTLERGTPLEVRLTRENAEQRPNL